MGNCGSSPSTTTRVGRPAAAKVIHVDGRLQEFPVPVRAGQVASQNPGCFLCSSESMFLDTHIPRICEGEELQVGHIYFLVPLAHAHNPLSLPDLCALAVKASAALAVSPPAAAYARRGCRTNGRPAWDHMTTPGRGNRGVKS
ncbi:hypothetical protein H6P81_021021 [Aristolochia fimbriata]|uniref:Uncharacterized protein n=1 Tax=Aristolochia fimbriata TaxID=158543 RepID=A0AAV7DXB2_ARIFI|nr:hypothetical protein H6P81_021021 [Aristolochia fimbriata]